MAITIVATAGSASANSFVTLAEYLAYLDGRLNATAATGAATADQNVSLVEATRELGLLGWEGSRTDATQALAWPRSFALNPDAPVPDDSVSPGYFATTEIPQRVKDATCELALEFLRAGTTDVASADTRANVIREKIDVLETEYADPTMRGRGIERYPRVWSMVGPLLVLGGNQARLVR